MKNIWIAKQRDGYSETINFKFIDDIISINANKHLVEYHKGNGWLPLEDFKLENIIIYLEKTL